MKIQRYHTKKENDTKVGFGDGVLTSRKVQVIEYDNLYRPWEFEWYFGANLIGASIRGSALDRSESFIRGIMFEDYKLILLPSQENPEIKRVGDKEKVLKGPYVNDLIQFIQNNDLTHMYISSEIPDCILSEIITFSSIEPSKKLYEKEKIISVEIGIAE